MPKKIAKIGDNKPPSPFDEVSTKINDYYDEAKNFLDGEKVVTQKMAEEIAKLIGLLRKHQKEAKTQKGVDKKPHLDANKKIEADYKVILSKADDAIATCKKALTPYLEMKEDKAKEAVEKANKEALAAVEVAQKAQAEASDSGDLSAVEDARAKNDKAMKMTKRANTLAKKPTNVKSEEGKAVGLKSRTVIVIDDLTEASRYFWRTDAGKLAFRECVLKLAKDEPGDIPGITKTIVKEAV